jgi:ketosteroid isomerase-like protein
MNKLLTIFLVSASISCTNQQALSETDLRVAIDQFNEAFEKGDVEMLSALTTENYVHTNGSWKSFGKGTWIEYMEGRSKKISNGTLIIESYEMEELSIEMHNDAAIATTQISTTGVEDGITFNKKFRVSNVWIYDGSRWLRAGFHDTMIE